MIHFGSGSCRREERGEMETGIKTNILLDLSSLVKYIVQILVLSASAKCLMHGR